MLPDVFTISHRKQIIALTAEHRLPTIHALRYFSTDGGLLSYGPSILGVIRLVGSYVDRILKGEDPREFARSGTDQIRACAQSQGHKALGLAVPDKLFSTADEVIE